MPKSISVHALLFKGGSMDKIQKYIQQFTWFRIFDGGSHIVETTYAFYFQLFLRVVR